MSDIPCAQRISGVGPAASAAALGREHDLADVAALDEHLLGVAGVFDTGSIAPTSAADVPVPFTRAGTYDFAARSNANETGSIVVTQ